LAATEPNVTLKSSPCKYDGGLFGNVPAIARRWFDGESVATWGTFGYLGPLALHENEPTDPWGDALVLTNNFVWLSPSVASRMVCVTAEASKKVAQGRGCDPGLVSRRIVRPQSGRRTAGRQRCDTLRVRDTYDATYPGSSASPPTLVRAIFFDGSAVTRHVSMRVIWRPNNRLQTLSRRREACGARTSRCTSCGRPERIGRRRGSEIPHPSPCG
jgi:hypothetical protein